MEIIKEAIKQKDINKIQQILALSNAKQIINKPDIQLQTNLFHAILNEEEEWGLKIFQLLLQKGADPYHKQQNGQTIIYYLAAQNKLKILQKALDLNYNLNESDRFGQTPLFFAASNGRTKVAELLIRHGCDVNHLDRNGQSPLFWAAKAGHLDMCKQLINRGCNPLHIDKLKKTAASFAKLGNHHHIADYLLSFKKQKEKIAKNSQSQTQNKKDKKAVVKKQKQSQKLQYLMVFTGQDGNTHQLGSAQLNQFLQNNEKIKHYLNNLQQLQNLTISNQDKVHKIGNRILNILFKRQDTLIFQDPVKYQDLKLFDYPLIVKQPMDYSTMKSKLMFNCYKTQQDFSKDMRLIYDNCILYNGLQSIYGKAASQLKHQYEINIKNQFFS